MGSYLEINNRETNCKAWSEILIGAIRNIDSRIKSNENSTEKEKKYFIPEYYKTTDDEGTFGCGDWRINKKGMALVVLYLKEMYEDDENIRKMAIEENKYSLERIENPGELNEIIEKYAKETKEDILWCFNYAVDILTDMLLTGMKRVNAHWV